MACQKDFSRAPSFRPPLHTDTVRHPVSELHHSISCLPPRSATSISTPSPPLSSSFFLSQISSRRRFASSAPSPSVVGQAVDTVLVITLTFAGTPPLRTLLNLIATSYALKVGYEIIATPLTYLVIHWLKSAEGADVFDRHESFNPFSFANPRQTEPSDS